MQYGKIAEIVNRILADFATVEGRLLQCDHVLTTVPGQDPACTEASDPSEPRILVQVTHLHVEQSCDVWLDPVWEVSSVDPRLPSGTHYIYGHSYHLITGECQPSEYSDAATTPTEG